MPSSEVEGRTWADKTAAHSTVSMWVPLRPDVCFDYVSDMHRHAEWATNRIQITSVDPSQKALGARYKAIGHQAGKDWPSDLEVTIYDRPLTFEFTATGGPLGTPENDLHRHTLKFKAEDGGTRIELTRRDPLPPNWSKTKARSGSNYRSSHLGKPKTNDRARKLRERLIQQGH